MTNDKTITWICHIDEKTSRENALYDMIIGMDLLTSIGVLVDTEKKVIRWGNLTTPLKKRGQLQDNTINLIYELTQESAVLQDAEERQSRILDADYSQGNIDEFVEEYQYE